MATSLVDSIQNMGASVFSGTGGQPQSSPANIAGNTGIVPPSSNGVPGAPVPPKPPLPPMGTTPPKPTGIAPLASESVTAQFNRITADGSPLIDMAKQTGLNLANRRGVLNSSIATGTAQGEAYKVALPLAQQEAQTAAARNTQQRDIDAQRERLATAGNQALEQIGAQGGVAKELAGLNNAAEMGRLTTQLAAADSQQSKDIAAQMTRLQASAAAEMSRLQASLAGADAQQTKDIQAQMERLRVSTDADMARLNEQGRQSLAQIGAQGQVQTGLATLNNAAELDRLTKQLASSDNQQAKSIAAEMDRLKTQLASADGQQKAEIQAQMDRLVTAGQQQLALSTVNNSAELDRLTKQLAASDSQQSKAIAADMDRLKVQLASADVQQKAEIEAQMSRLVVSGQQELDRLGKAAGYDQDRVKLEGTIQAALSSQGAEQSKALATLQGDIQSKLQGQTDTAAMSRLSAQFAHDLVVVDKQNSSDLAKITASGDQNMRQLLQQQDGSLKELSMQLAAGDRQKIADLTVSIFEKEAAMRAALLSNTTMPASERAAYERAISSMGDPVRAYLNQLYAAPTSAPPAAGGGIAPVYGGSPTDGAGNVITAPAGGGAAPIASSPTGIAPGGGLGAGGGGFSGGDSYSAPQPNLSQPSYLAGTAAQEPMGIAPVAAGPTGEEPGYDGRELRRQQLGVLA
jgi:hypothetical protein